MKGKCPMIHAHRGASAYAPENTLEAFALAVEMDADFIELDVRMTKDNQIVVIHDNTIDRVSNGSGRVSDMLYEELLKYSFNNNMQKYQNVRIPLIEDVLKLVLPTKISLNIEIKSDFGKIEKKLIALEREFQMQQRTMYSSFNHECMAHMAQIYPGTKTALLYFAPPKSPAKLAKRLGAFAIHPEYRRFIPSGQIFACKAYGIQSNVWTVDDPNNIRLCKFIGVNGIITNVPDTARRICPR